MPKSKYPPTTVEKLLRRAPSVRKTLSTAVPRYADDLARLWDAQERDHPSEHHASGALADRIRGVLASNRAKFGSRGGPLLMERLANSLPEPAAVSTQKGHTWNEAFEAAFARNPDRPAAIRETLALLDRLSAERGKLDLPMFLFPLDSGIFNLRVVSLQDEGVTLYYFFGTDLDNPKLPLTPRFICCARLNGLPLKQIAVLLDMTYEHVERLSKKYRPEYLRMKRGMA